MATHCYHLIMRGICATALAVLGACTTPDIPVADAGAAIPADNSARPVQPALATVHSDSELATYIARLSATFDDPLPSETAGYYLDVQTAKLQSLYSGDVDVEQMGNHVRLVIHGAGNFATDSTVLTPAMQDKLDVLAGLLAEYQQSAAMIAGHTDNQGEPAYNRLLSRERAMAVARYLDKQGVAEPRLVVRGFGDTRPVRENTTAAGRATNRRIEVELWPLIAADAG